MGWCNGSHIADELYDKIREFLPEDKRNEIAKDIYDLFTSYDADCWEFSDLTEDSGEMIRCSRCDEGVWKEEIKDNLCWDCRPEGEE